MKNSDTAWIEALQGALLCPADTVPPEYLSIEQLQKLFKNKEGKEYSNSQIRKRVTALVKARKVEPKLFNILAGGDGKLRKVMHFRLLK